MHFVGLYCINISLVIRLHIPIVQPTRCTCFLKLFILVKLCTCFGLSVHHQELKTKYTATVYVKQLLLPAAIGDEMERSSISSPIAAGSSSFLTYNVAVYAFLCS
jgi:hypothetical protein